MSNLAILSRNSGFCNSNGDWESITVVDLATGGTETYRSNNHGTEDGYYEAQKLVEAPEAVKELMEVKNRLKSKDNDKAGAIVILKGSRKAVNKKPLTVLDYCEGGWNGYGMEPNKIKVVGKTGEPVWVSATCINTTIVGG